MGTTIDSHSSYLNNKRLIIIFAKIDDCGSLAARTKHFQHIEQYYNEIEQIYINVAKVLNPATTERIGAVRKGYAKVKFLVENDARYQTKRSLEFLLKCAKEFNLQVVSGLQEFEYFFRTGQRQTKGLKNITFFENSIFGDKNDVKREAEE